MKPFQWLFGAIFLLSLTSAQAQKATVTGKITDKTSKQPLEYATVTFLKPGDTKPVAGGITDTKGEYSIDVVPGTYDINFEFISFKTVSLKNQSIDASKRLANVELADDSQLLNEVVIRAERTTVEIKLDKKVYNVGQDLMVKGGTVSDVLDNIPSVSVDQDGTISLRGNENVRILIDGKPSNAISVADALRTIPADAIEKVEVVTNPSARYDSEGGGGLLNIILKKGKNQGINGQLLGTVGDPENYGLSGNVNFKSEDVNVFTTTGYNYRRSPGNALTDTHYLTTDTYTNERRSNDRLSRGINSTTGFDWYIDKSLTWTNQINLRTSNNENPETVKYYNYDANRAFTGMTTRFSDETGTDENFEYSTNITKNFKKEGHKLTINAAWSINKDNDIADINYGDELTTNLADQNRNVYMADYVLPIGKDSQFEAGYKGEFNRNLTDYSVGAFNDATQQYDLNYNFTNKLDYKEKINALYMQYGSKHGKFSYLAGLRWEDSNIDINQLFTQDYNNKHYNNFFPSLFLTYELADESSISLSYSRRISRPRGRLLNPFSNYSSNINLFQGNPDLDPAFSNSFDLGYLKRWKKLTFSTSAFVNITTDSFQFVRRESGDFVDNADGSQTPVILTTPINLGREYRAGFEFTLNYSPFKWWKINSNFNLFRNETQGDYSFTLTDGTIDTQSFDNVAYSWSTRLTSKVNLPWKIDWQTNFNYNGPQTNAQGKSKGVPSMNLGLSKDLFKEKATIALNCQDVFNSRKRINETHIPGVLDSYSEMQWRVRQITLSLTYRFNKKKNERDQRDRQPRDGEGGGNDEFPG
ncbi:outer membrane beta-barrel family protein [Flavobacterium sp.]|uniref:outer membrane beta-barrel family protein n=1 Tax=Flavobacterium sp. TaxID=239 RepID=UPI0012034083|nr:outer membrane beta-barrel family protein [Flavobacterium sp.]RZJ72856.1 MAG: TonB-dependent receptor [Flavobacterium sp.]